VVGSASAAPEDEVLVLRNGQGTPELIVCAVPYLRDRDIRVATAGESIEDKERKLLDGIRDHYAAVAALAEQKREELGPDISADIPIVGMGHLFVIGGQSIEGDGVRDLYVGSLAHVSAGIFPACFDYLALGHLHAPQKVNGSETMRYSGSPLPMSFGEANQQKSVCRVAFHGTAASVCLIDVPVFQELERLQGDWNSIAGRIAALAAAASLTWLEVIYDGGDSGDSGDVIGDLREHLDAAVSGTPMEVLRVKNNRIIDRVLEQSLAGEALDDLDENEVFERCLRAHDVPEDQRPELRRSYRETLAALYEDDSQAE
jgi:exonuclease SbcD